MADGVGEGVDVVVAKLRALLGRCQFRGEREVGIGPALRSDQKIHQSPLAGAGIADVDALALQIVEDGHAGILAGHNGERLGVQREHGAQVFVLAGVGEIRLAIIGVVLNVGLHDTEFQVAALDRVHVEHRTAGRFDRAADAVFAAVLVHQTADRTARRIIDASDAARSDRDELLILSARGAHAGGAEQRGRQAHSQELVWLHVCVSFCCTLALSGV